MEWFGHFTVNDHGNAVTRNVVCNAVTQPGVEYQGHEKCKNDRHPVKYTHFLICWGSDPVGPCRTLSDPIGPNRTLSDPVGPVGLSDCRTVGRLED
eukprot:78715-Prymnesium_polylepis.1